MKKYEVTLVKMSSHTGTIVVEASSRSAALNIALCHQNEADWDDGMENLFCHDDADVIAVEEVHSDA